MNCILFTSYCSYCTKMHVTTGSRHVGSLQHSLSPSSYMNVKG